MLPRGDLETSINLKIHSIYKGVISDVSKEYSRDNYY